MNSPIWARSASLLVCLATTAACSPAPSSGDAATRPDVTAPRDASGDRPVANDAATTVDAYPDAPEPADVSTPPDAAPGPEVDVARGRAATAWHTDAASMPALALDGDPATGWTTGWTPASHSYLDVELGGWYLLSRASLTLPAGSSRPAFELQYWDGCWKPIPGAASRSPEESASLTFSSEVVARRVRFTCTASGPCGLRELSVTGRSVLEPRAPMGCNAGEQIAVRHPGYDHALYLPAAYNADRTRRWPLVISLHGIGGDTLAADHATVSPNPEGVAHQFLDAAFRASFQGIAISLNGAAMGNPGGARWFNPEVIMQIVAHAGDDLLVDTDRVSLAGISGGTNTAWAILVEHPEINVAAFVPTACTATPGNWPALCAATRIPIWAFQGSGDYPAEQCIGPRDRLDACAGSARVAQCTVIEGGGHGPDTWNNAFGRADLWAWAFAQRRSARP